MDELLAAWEVQPKGTGALSELEAFARFHIHFHLERPDAVFIAYMELRNLSDDNFAAIEALRREYEGKLEGILRAGQDEGVINTPDIRLTTMALIAMLTGVNTWYRDGGRLSRDAVADIYWDMVRGAVGA